MDKEWKTAWSYVPVEYDMDLAVLKNLTQRSRFRSNLSGTKIRVRFSNLLGRTAMVLEKVTIGCADSTDGEIRHITNLTVAGSEKITIEARTEYYSDEAVFPANAGEDLVLSVYFKEAQPVRSVCITNSQRCWSTRYEAGDTTEKPVCGGKSCSEIYPVMPEGEFSLAAGISEIQVLTEEDVKTIVLLGDSITHMSYYSDALTERLYETCPGEVTVINRGIGGNRLLHDARSIEDCFGHAKQYGEAGLPRALHMADNADLILLLEGINDLYHARQYGWEEEITSAEDLEAGYESVIRHVREKGAKILLGTIMPCRSETGTWIPEAEQERIRVNAWIRGQKSADGFIDFAAAVEDPVNPQYMKKNYHVGDGLHPNTAGGRAMAEAALPKIMAVLKQNTEGIFS